jgi:hypothetical protein
MVTQPNRRSAAIVAALAIALIATMTLQPAVSSNNLPFSCLFCGSLGGVDFVLNTVLFMPLGLGLYWLLRDGRTALLTGVAATLLIELLQWRFIPGRDASLGDLLANSIGTALGIGLARVGAAWVMATGRTARKLAATSAALSTLVVGLSSWLLQPVSVRTPLSVQWKPSRVNMDDFQGELRAAALHGEPIRATEVIIPPRLLDPETRSLTVTASISGEVEPSRRQAIILRFASHWEEGFFLGQWRESLIARTHVVAERFKFRPPLVGLKGALSPPVDKVGGAGQNLIVEVVSNPRAMTVRVNRPDNPTVAVPRTAGLGWTLLLPWDVAITPGWWIANAAWLAALVLPVGYFTARSARHATRSGWANRWPLLLSLGALIAGPSMFGLSMLGVGEWAGVLTGLIAGAAIARPIATDLRPTLNQRSPAGTGLT